LLAACNTSGGSSPRVVSGALDRRNIAREWREPRGQFSWKKVGQLEFAAEHEDMRSQTVWFDAVKIVVP